MRFTLLCLCMALTLLIVYAEPTGAETADTINVRIAFTNAVQGNALQARDCLGLARFKTQAQTLGADLLLDLSDIYFGKAFATMTNGESMADTLSAVGYDAMLCGWTEFLYGLPKLMELEERSGVPILTANVTKADTGASFFSTPYIIKEVNGLMVGVFGVIDPQLLDYQSVSLSAELRYRNPIPVAKQFVEALAEEGCQIIICMTSALCADEIADEVAGIDLILAGGEGTELAVDRTHGAPIVSTMPELKGFSLATLIYDPDIYCVDRVTVESYTASECANTVPDPLVQAVIAQAGEALNPELSEVISITPVTLRAADPDDPYMETELPRLITDVYRAAAGTDIAFISAAGMRADISAGSITYEALLDSVPPRMTLMTLAVPGYVIRNMLEKSTDSLTMANDPVAAADAHFGMARERLYASGLTYEFDDTEPRWQRVFNIRVGDHPLEMNRIYTVAVTQALRNMPAYPDLHETEVIRTIGSCASAIKHSVMLYGVERAVNETPRAVRIDIR